MESDVRNPLGIYGKSKAAGEESIEKVFNCGQESLSESNEIKRTNLEAQYAILRTSWVYGDGGNFIRTILRLAIDRETLKVIADQYGVPTSATWLAEVSLALALDEHHQLRPFPSGIYHAVPLGETTWHALALLRSSGGNRGRCSAKSCAQKLLKQFLQRNTALPAPRPMNSSMKRVARCRP